MNLPPRPTLYNGIQMRSRLEALYAAHLDDLGLPWQYEPECFASPAGQYLPDFLIAGPSLGSLVNWVEVKPPTADLDAAHAQMHIIHASRPGDVIIVTTTTGTWPNITFVSARSCSGAYPCPQCIARKERS